MSVATRIKDWLTGADYRGAYTDAITQAIVSNAAGSSGPINSSVAAGVGAVQGASSLYGLAFAGAEVSPEDRVTRSLEPGILSAMARQVVVHGESFWLLEVENGLASLVPLSGVTVNGSSPNRMRWSYEGNVNSPDATGTGVFPASRVLHLQWDFDPVAPWRGIAPLQRCQLSAELLAGIERGLKSEHRDEPRRILPIPTEPNRSDFDDWKTDLAASRGGSLVLGKTFMGAASSGWGSTPRGDYKQSRLGPEPNASTIELRSHVAAHVLMALGVDPALANPDPKTGALQAAYRSFLTGSATSLAKIVRTELSRKLERDVRIRFASDVDNRRLRASALKSMVEAGIDLAEAKRLAGFEFE